MSCDDLDKLRTQSVSRHSSTWPLEAREHLESCESCSQLQKLLDNSVQSDVPDAILDRVEAAILPGLLPVSPLPSVSRITGALLLCLIGVIAAANWHLGVAGWNARDNLQISVNFSLLGISVVVLANILARQMMPGSRRSAPVFVYIAVPLIALVAADAALFGYHSNPDFVPLALSCWEIGVTCAALSAPLFWLALRRGLSLNPIGHGATAGLLAGLVGVTVLEIYCPYLDRWHITVAHIGAAIASTLVGAVIGSIKSRIQQHGP